MKKILDLITEEMEQAFADAGYEKELARVTLSNRPDLCEYQCNGAMAGAKKYHKAPIMIAEEVVAKIPENGYISGAEAVKPGFINLKTNPAAVADYLNQMEADEKLGVEEVENPKTIVIDYGGPNVAKPLHVGHLRSAIIGESVKRITRFMGNKVVGDIHLGDWVEDQLVGKNAGDEVDVNVTFPEKYQAADLAGKPALFKVKIHEVKAKELPELNDEFAQDVSEFNTLEEYKEDLKKHLEVQKEDEAKRTKEDEAIQKIIDKSTMEIPEAMIKTQCENMVNEFAQRLAQSGLSMEQYMQFSGLTLDKLEEQVRPEAETRIKSSLVLEQIAKDENIEVSEEEIDAEIEKMAKAYGMEADKLKEYMGDAEKESMKRDISVTKAVDLVMENVKERAKAKTKKEKEAEAEENAEE